MTATITENALPDEDTLVFPDAWREYLHPRRGGAAGPRVTIDRKAPVATDALIATARANWLDRALTKPTNDPATVRHVRRTLDGEPNPTGAAALAPAAVPRWDGPLKADRLVPDLGLDADGGLWLDYGPRRFRVGFDEHLKPFVTDQAGTRRKDPPAPNAKGDAELAAARKQFTALKKETRAASADQIRILGLTKHGWSRSSPMDNGIENCITRRLDAARYLVIDLYDGIPVGNVSEDFAAEQTFEAVYLSTDAEVYHAGHRDSGLRFGDLDPLIASELLGQLTRLVD
jgi:hypothetical protein